MLYPLASTTCRLTASSPGFTAVGAFSAYGRTVTQTQYMTDRFVVTEIEKGTFVFLASHRERFLFEEPAGILRRLEPNLHRIQREKLRMVIGEITVRKEDERVEVDGFLCDRYHFRSAEARILIEGETLAASLPGVDSTALPLEREHDATIQPFCLPLAADQIVVQSLLRTTASGFDQVQSYRLVAVSASIDDPERFERLAELPIVG